MFRAAVEAELRRINISRNRYAFTVQFGLLIFSIWYQDTFSHPLSAFILALGGCGCLLRIVATEVIPEEEKVSDVFLWIGFAFLSFAWVFHIDQAVTLHSMSGPTIATLRVLVGILLLSNHAFLIADIKSGYAFILPISVGLIIMPGYPLGSYLTIAVLSILGLHQQHRQLKEYIRARLENTHERNRHKTIIDGFPGFVSILNHEGVYVDANQMVLKYFPGLIGTRLGELSSNSSFSQFAQGFLQSEKEFDTAETEVTVNGELYHLLTTCRRLEDGIFLTSIPINELVKARKDLREQEAVAMYSSKLASVGQMAAGVAHEVNNPLAIIQGSARIISELVNEENVDRENLKIFSDRIIATTDRIAQIVRSLRSLSRGGEQDPFSPLSIASVISSCLDISNHNLKRYNIKIHVPDGKKDMTILGREVQLGQVVLNLLSNSIYAVKDRSERWVKIDYGHKDGVVWIEVSDSGKGIPEDVAKKMMEPFFTTKGKEEGTGLGLAISSRILEDHGGRLEYLKGCPNTTFRMTFPTPKV